MSNRTVLRHARNAAAAMVIAVAAFGLTACDGSGTDTPSPAGSSSAVSDPAQSATTTPEAGQGKTDQGKADQGSATGTPAATPKQSGERCTDQLNYAGDSRSNAEINSIGEETGHCPAPQKGDKPLGTPKKDGVSCTNQINYAEDARSNAVINTIGEKTGYCPPVQK
ncbi:hypothetical protein [Streptomyces olivaceiscleroticus]|uniref:Secreted protein n=1 Tax=Streptomyces olivaceiscleroticus TaxID=68245 RepID=A0ABP3K9W3_9ACTN